MAPAADYLFILIETVINTVSMFAMVPCIWTIIRAGRLHLNCKFLLVTSSLAQFALLVVQTAMFIFNFVTGNLMVDSLEKERNYVMAQNICFTFSSCLSLALVLERSVAIWKAAAYQRERYHLRLLIPLIICSLAVVVGIVYMIYFDDLLFESIYIVVGMELTTVSISIAILIYSRRKIKFIPFDRDRMDAQIQARFLVREVQHFSAAILPSIVITTVLHCLSLVPTAITASDIMSYPLGSLFFFSIHSLNCCLSKLALIFCHADMRVHFKQIFGIKPPATTPIARNTADEASLYFANLRTSWGDEIEEPKKRNPANYKISPL